MFYKVFHSISKLFGGIGYGHPHELGAKIRFHCHGYFILILRLKFWGDLGFEIRPWTVEDRPPGWRGPYDPLARTVRPLAESPIDLAHTFQVIILLLLGFFIF